MKNYWWIVVLGVALLVLNIQPFSLVQIERPGGVSGYDALGTCQFHANEEASYIQTYSTVAISTCMDCPKAYFVRQSWCDLECGQVCPAGYSCSYPPDLICKEGKCVGGICPGENWHESPGCHQSTSDPAFVSYVLAQEDIGTAVESGAQARVIEWCGNIQIPTVAGSTTPNYNTTQPPNPSPTGNTNLLFLVVVGGAVVATIWYFSKKGR